MTEKQLCQDPGCWGRGTVGSVPGAQLDTAFSPTTHPGLGHCSGHQSPHPDHQAIERLHELPRPTQGGVCRPPQAQRHPGLPTPLGGSESHSWAPDPSHQRPRREDRCPAGRLASPQRPAAQASHRPPALAGECPRSSRMTSLPGTTTWETPYPRLLYRRRLRDPEARPHAWGADLGPRGWATQEGTEPRTGPPGRRPGGLCLGQGQPPSGSS